MDLLRAIRHLLYAEGYTIKGVQKILKDQGARHIQTMGADLLEGRPVDVIGRAPAEVASTPKPGLLGSLLPGRRAKNEAPLIADRSGPAFDDSDLYEDPPEPARPAPAPRARAPEPARAPARPRPEDPPMARPEAGRQAAPAPAPVRARRAADRPLEAFDPPDAFLPGFEMPQPAIDLPDERARPAAQGRAPDFEAFDDYPDDRIGREPRFDDLRADPAYRPEPTYRAEPAMRSEPTMRSESAMRSEPPPRHEPAPIRHEPPVRAEPSYRAEPAPRSETPVLRSEPRHSPALAVPAEPAAAQNDHNLAEMAQQLEAALRRPPAPEARPPVTDPLASQPAVAEQRPANRDYKLRVDPQFEARQALKPEPRFEAQPEFEVRPEPRAPEARPRAAAPGPQPAAPQVAGPPPVFNSLEEEMASLLGRPPGKP
ncbi:MAG: hypothetical protein B7Y75_05290 [Azorhizobium sp. 35-67-5]|nr:MAG: hypothetical protein B7Y75_05290 [Azorhizobium sp. 35-67-5]